MVMRIGVIVILKHPCPAVLPDHAIVISFFSYGLSKGNVIIHQRNSGAKLAPTVSKYILDLILVSIGTFNNVHSEGISQTSFAKITKPFKNKAKIIATINMNPPA